MSMASEGTPFNSTARVRRGVVSLFLANGLSFVAVGLSYLVLSRILTPAELGLYSAALVIGSFGTMVLDAGVKNTVIKSQINVTKSQEEVLVGLLLVGSILLVAILLLSYRPLSYLRPEVQHDYLFLVLFGAIYLVSYPFIVVPTAMLERRLAYTGLAWIESLGLLIERAAPLPLLLWSQAGIHSFTIALLVGRALRVIALTMMYPVRPRLPTRERAREIWHLLVEGVWFQLAIATALVRDNLAVILIGPLFGKQWMGYYAWGLQLCMIASQAFVQIASRVSLPVLAQSSNSNERWAYCVTQSKVLTIFTGPVLLVLLSVISQADRVLFGGKWQVATLLLPFLFLRTLPGMSTTPLGILVMVQAGSRAYAKASAIWTAAEFAGALALVTLLGPTGLAWSLAFLAWVGYAALLRAAGPRPPQVLKELLVAILVRPSLLCAAAGALVLHYFSASNLLPFWLVCFLAAVIVFGSVATEPTVRRMAAQRRRA